MKTKTMSALLRAVLLAAGALYLALSLLPQGTLAVVEQNGQEADKWLRRAAEQGVPVTNYGVALAALNGILDRIDLP